jgi:chemotaxis protein CheX
MTIAEARPLVTGEQIAEITRDVWSSFLSLDLEIAPVDPHASLSGRTSTGCVHISGEWNGTVFVQCSSEHAAKAAEAMFMADPGTLGEDEISDALGELTNMVGGNIKSLLPEPCKLSIPTVAGGENYTVRVPGAHLVDAVTLIGPAGPVHLSLWKV